MKKSILFGVFALLTTTLFSCSADEPEADKTSGKTETTKIVNPADSPAQAVDGPEDEPVIVPPPPKK